MIFYFTWLTSGLFYANAYCMEGFSISKFQIRLQVATHLYSLLISLATSFIFTKFYNVLLLMYMFH